MSDPVIIEIVVPSGPATVEVVTTGPQGPAGSINGLGTAALLNIHVGDTPPENPTLNQVWIDTND